MREETASEVSRRIARDLREDLGARLLNQLHQTHDETVARSTRAMLGELRAMLDALDPRRYPLADCVDQWRAAFLEQCSAAGIQAQLQLPQVLPSLALTPVQRSHPRRIVAEFLENALRHAQPRNAWLVLQLNGAALDVRCRHDGRSTLPPDWRAGRGLRNQQLRAEDLDSSLQWRPSGPDMIELQFSFAVGEAGGPETAP